MDIFKRLFGDNEDNTKGPYKQTPLTQADTESLTDQELDELASSLELEIDRGFENQANDIEAIASGTQVNLGTDFYLNGPVMEGDEILGREKNRLAERHNDLLTVEEEQKKRGKFFGLF